MTEENVEEITTTETSQLVPREEFKPSRSYATRKTIALGALDIALLMSNASQLTAVMDRHEDESRLFYPLVVMIVISVVLQVITGTVLVWLAFINPTTDISIKRTILLNNASVCLVLVITVVNIFIAAFGITHAVETAQP